MFIVKSNDSNLIHIWFIKYYGKAMNVRAYYECSLNISWMYACRLGRLKQSCINVVPTLCNVVSALCNVISTLFQRRALTFYQRCATLKIRRRILFHFQRRISVISTLIHKQRWSNVEMLAGLLFQNKYTLCVTSSIEGWDQRLQLIKFHVILENLLWNNKIKNLSVSVKQNHPFLSTWIHV